MAPLGRWSGGVALVALAAAEPRNATDCSDNEGFRTSCAALEGRPAAEISAGCNDAEPELCDGVPVFHLCPKQCEACLVYDRALGAECAKDRTAGFLRRLYDRRGVGVVLLVLMCLCCPCCQLYFLIGAHRKRAQFLKAAREGEPLQPPASFFSLCCCGHAAIYAWEGFSRNWLIAFWLWPWYPLCCWARSKFPLEDGVQVLPPGVDGVQASSQPQISQPPSAAVGSLGGAVVGAPMEEKSSAPAQPAAVPSRKRSSAAASQARAVHPSDEPQEQAARPSAGVEEKGPAAAPPQERAAPRSGGQAKATSRASPANAAAVGAPLSISL